jgi:hypothetical protein
MSLVLLIVAGLFLVTIFQATAIQLDLISDHGFWTLGSKMRRGEIRVRDVYWRDLSIRQRLLLWPGIVAFFLLWLGLGGVSLVTWLVR